MDNLNVAKWIKFAQTDFDHVIKTVETHHPIPVEIMCYHCEQSIEKILKAFMIAKGGTLTKTHDLDVLLERCKQHSPDFDIFDDACERITTYTTPSRYPSDIELTESDMRQAIKDASKILEFTKAKLAEMGFGA